MEDKVIYDVFHQIYWDAKIALDLFFGGIGVGAFLFAVLISIFYKDTHREVSKTGAYIAPFSLLIGLFFLFLELGQPFRIWKFYTTFRFGSPLSWGAWFQGTFIVIALYYLYLWRKGDDEKRRLVGYIGIPFALIVGGYHGYLLTIVKAKPIWYGGPSTITAIVGFILTGMAAVILILSLKKDARSILSSIKLSRDFLGVAIVTQIITLYLWGISLYYGPFRMERSFERFNEVFGWLFWGGVIVLGLILPLIIGGLAVLKERRSKEHRTSITIPIITSALVLLGGFLLRYVWVLGGQIF